MLEIRLFGKKLVFSFWFFAVIAVFALLDTAFLALYIAVPILIHEAGHLAVMILCKVRVSEVRFTAFSVDIRRMDQLPLPLPIELMVHLGGILANLITALFLHLFTFHSMRHMFLTAANLAVALFNLLPIGSLDGGNMVRTLCERYFHPLRAVQISRLVSFLALTPLFALSGVVILYGYRNFTLLLTCIYLAVTIIIRDWK